MPDPFAPGCRPREKVISSTQCNRFSIEYAFADVSCRFLDHDTCQCSDYANRQHNVPDCVKVTSTSIAELRWMPETCAYRLLAEGKPLFWWHPLVSGDPETVHTSGASVRGKAINEDMVDDLEEHIVEELNRKLRDGIPPLPDHLPDRRNSPKQK